MNTSKLVYKRKWFWPWQDEEEENWLRELSKQGLHLKTPGYFSRYVFEQGEPRETIYRFDFQNKAAKDLVDYYQLFRDAGWEHVGVLGGWQYFRKPYTPGEVNEIFTDNTSKVDKYRRLLLFLIVPCLLVINPLLNPALHSRWAVPFQVFFGFVALFFIFMLARILWRIRQLQKG